MSEIRIIMAGSGGRSLLMGTKVVYNANYGGYFIPQEVLKKYNELANTNHTSQFIDSIPRHDKLYVQLIEEYKKTNNTSLDIFEIRGNRYMIQEYDGFESVIEPNDIDWIEVDDA